MEHDVNESLQANQYPWDTTPAVAADIPSSSINNDQLKTSKGQGSHNNNNNNNNNGNGNDNNPNNGQKPRPHNRERFTGLNQDELKNLVIDGSKSQQYDKLFEGLKVMAGKKSSNLKTSLLTLKEKTEKDFLPTLPAKLEYVLTIKDGNGMLSNLWSKKAERSVKKYDQYIKQLKNLFSTIEGQLSKSVQHKLKANMDCKYCYRDGSNMIHPMIDVAYKVSWFLNCKDMNKDATTAYHTLAKKQPSTTYKAYKKLTGEAKKKILDDMEEKLLSIVAINGAHPKSHHNVARMHIHSPHQLELMQQYKSVKPHTGVNSSGPSGGWGSNNSNGKTNMDAKGDNQPTGETSLTTKGVEPTVDDAHQILMAGVKDGQFDDEFVCFVQTATINNSQCWELTSVCNIKHKPKCLHTNEDFDEALVHKPRSGDITTNPNTTFNLNWILLDSQATCNCISNPKLLRNIQIHPEGRRVNIHCNPRCAAPVDHVGACLVLAPFGTSLEVWQTSYLSVLCLMDTKSPWIPQFHRPSSSTKRMGHDAIMPITTLGGQKEFYLDLNI
eukprot:jgi/Psemu1/11419/gm1.11419_g